MPRFCLQVGVWSRAWQVAAMGYARPRFLLSSYAESFVCRSEFISLCVVPSARAPPSNLLPPALLPGYVSPSLPLAPTASSQVPSSSSASSNSSALPTAPPLLHPSECTTLYLRVSNLPLPASAAGVSGVGFTTSADIAPHNPLKPVWKEQLLLPSHHITPAYTEVPFVCFVAFCLLFVQERVRSTVFLCGCLCPLLNVGGFERRFIYSHTHIFCLLCSHARQSFRFLSVRCFPLPCFCPFHFDLSSDSQPLPHAVSRRIGYGEGFAARKRVPQSADEPQRCGAARQRQRPVGCGDCVVLHRPKAIWYEPEITDSLNL
jgi:hypothetical protein